MRGVGAVLRGAPRAATGLAVLGAALLVAPLLVDDYLLSVILITLYFAFVGQAWNLMMGYAGQLSLGHALYVGLGGYAAAAFFVHFGLTPWAGMVIGILVAAAFAAGIGLLAFRFGIGGVYFALLTIAVAEFTRILFEHFEWVGATGGFFLPVENREINDLLMLRGSPAMFYYVILAMTVGLFLANVALIRSRMGYYWMAIREDQDAAQALGINTFRYKMMAVVLSASLTALGGVFLAFYNNNLFPIDAFGIHRSIEIILAPIIGGLGTLFGPILGAFILTPLGEVLTWALDQLGVQMAGVKHLFYGLVLLVIIRSLPGGVWPWFARRLGIEGPEARP